MAYKRHTDFYIPVLKTLEDLKGHEVNVELWESFYDFRCSAIKTPLQTQGLCLRCKSI